MKKLQIAIDFDGTCVKHKYPEVGPDVIEAANVLRELVANGHQLILYTMRSGEYLKDAVNWFKKQEIPLFGIQKHPTQHTWTKAAKCYAQLYIDDAALGCPLVFPGEGQRPYADWIKIREMLKERGLI